MERSVRQKKRCMVVNRSPNGRGARGEEREEKKGGER